jgi:hypothetical protein
MGDQWRLLVSARTVPRYSNGEGVKTRRPDDRQMRHLLTVARVPRMRPLVTREKCGWIVAGRRKPFASYCALLERRHWAGRRGKAQGVEAHRGRERGEPRTTWQSVSLEVCCRRLSALAVSRRLALAVVQCRADKSVVSRVSSGALWGRQTKPGHRFFLLAPLLSVAFAPNAE